MKTFIISYVISLGIMVAAWFPDVMARPFHILPRLAFYMAFPTAVFLALALIFLVSIFGIIKPDKTAMDISSHWSANERYFKKSA